MDKIENVKAEHESRLLTYSDLKLYNIGEISGDITNLLKAQDAKTASICNYILDKGKCQRLKWGRWG